MRIYESASNSIPSEMFEVFIKKSVFQINYFLFTVHGW